MIITANSYAFLKPFACLVVFFVSIMPFSSGQDNEILQTSLNGPSIIDNQPVAVPVISEEDAIKANEEALEFYSKKEQIAELKDTTSIFESPSKDRPLPVAVPVLSSEEAIKANREALQYLKRIRTPKFLHSLQSFFKQYFILFVLGLIILVSEIVIKTNTDQEKNKKNMSLDKEPLVQTILPVTFLLFNIIIFIPWSVFLGNASNFSFVFNDFFFKNLAVFLVTEIILVVILCFIPAGVRGILLSVITGLCFCFYFQSMFMNVYMGIMDGNEPNWAQHRLWGIINLIIWGIIVLLPLLIKKRYPSHWQTITWLTTAVLGLEFIAVFSQACSAPKSVWFRNQQYYCDASNQFHLSKEKNILVFIFDALASGYTRQCFDDDPHLKEVMKDFTWYPDALSNYESTIWGIPNEMTGGLFHPAENYGQANKNLWHSASAESFYKQIKNAGYDSKIYLEGECAVCDITCDYFSNIVKKEIGYTADNSKLFRCLVKISGFSSVPYLFKKFFFYGDDFSDDVMQQHIISSSAEQVVPLDYTNDRLYKKLISGGITTDAFSPVLSFHYTRGSHPPWTVDEKCQYKKDIDSFLPPSKSCYFLIAELIRLLKDNHIYDQTSIIICSDHGYSTSVGFPTGGKHAMTFMVKPFFANNKEIQLDYSMVQSIDLLPTLLQLACDDKADYTELEGFPTSNIPQDRQRKIYSLRYDDLFDDYTLLDGNSYSFNCFDEYFIDDSDKSKRRFFQRTIPLKAHEN